MVAAPDRTDWVAREDRRRRRWQQHPEWQQPGDGIISQAFWSAVCGALPCRDARDVLWRRWVMLRWHGAEVDDLAAQFCEEPETIWRALTSARERLEDHRRWLIQALADDADEVLDCMRNSRYSRSGPPFMPADWKADVNTAKGEHSDTPAKPTIRVVGSTQAATRRFNYLLLLLEKKRC